MNVGILSVSHNFNKHRKNSSDVAIGRYIKHTLDAFNLKKGDNLTLITNKEDQFEWQSDKYKIDFVFKKSFGLILRLFQYFRKNTFDVVHFQHEFFIYGPPLNALLITILFRFFRFSRIVTAHHVVDIHKIDAKFIKSNNYKYPVFIVKFVLFVSYFFMILCMDRIIVHEELHKNIFINNWKWLFKNIDKKIEIVHHGIGIKKQIDKQESRSKLGLKAQNYLLFFGYLSKHKGLDILIDAVEILQKQKKDISLIVISAEHPKFKNKLWYKNYYKKLQNKALSLKNAYWRGFVEDEELPLIFSAADIGVFPYRVRQGASGSVTDSISYSLPVLLSDQFKGIEIFKNYIFKNNAQDLSIKILDNIYMKDELKKNVKQWQKDLSWEKSAQQQYDLYKSLKSQNG